LQKLKEETFRTTGTIYIEPLATRPPPIFCENFRKEKNIEPKSFEAFKRVIIVGEGLEETLQGL
jgi:hypothetical protein